MADEHTDKKIEDRAAEKPRSESHHSEKKHSHTLTDTIRENPWILSTIVLGIVTILLLVGNFSGSAGGTIGTADQAEVEAKVLTFLNSQVEEEVTLVNSQIKNGLYEITVSYQDIELPVYATLDGEALVQGVTPLSVLQEQLNNANSNTVQPPTEVPKSNKPKIELFVMSMCPYGTQAEKGILPAINALGNKVDFELKFVSYAMHGKNEVDENTVQYCMQKEQKAKFQDYLTCYLEEGTPEAWKACRTKVGIDETKLQNCIKTTDAQFKITELFNDKSTWSGGSYPQYNTNKEDNIKYGVRGSPTLIINGVESNAGRSSASYLAGICAAFNTAPSECNTQLLTTTSSAGFGGGTAADDVAAQCL